MRVIIPRPSADQAYLLDPQTYIDGAGAIVMGLVNGASQAFRGALKTLLVFGLPELRAQVLAVTGQPAPARPADMDTIAYAVQLLLLIISQEVMQIEQINVVTQESPDGTEIIGFARPDHNPGG